MSNGVFMGIQLNLYYQNNICTYGGMQTRKFCKRAWFYIIALKINMCDVLLSFSFLY